MESQLREVCMGGLTGFAGLKFGVLYFREKILLILSKKFGRKACRGGLGGSFFDRIYRIAGLTGLNFFLFSFVEAILVSVMKTFGSEVEEQGVIDASGSEVVDCLDFVRSEEGFTCFEL